MAIWTCFRCPKNASWLLSGSMNWRGGKVTWTRHDWLAHESHRLRPWFNDRGGRMRRNDRISRYIIDETHRVFFLSFENFTSIGNRHRRQLTERVLSVVWIIPKQVQREWVENSGQAYKQHQKNSLGPTILQTEMTKSRIVIFGRVDQQIVQGVLAKTFSNASKLVWIKRSGIWIDSIRNKICNVKVWGR